MDAVVNQGLYPHYIVLLIPIFLITSIPIRMLTRKMNLVISHSMILYMLAIVMGIVVSYVPALDAYQVAVLLPPQNMFSVMLPMFIVSSIYRMDYYIFIRCLPQVMVISIFSVLVKALILSVILSGILHTNWTFSEGLLVSLVFLPIQPTHVIIMFKELAKYKYLGTMLEAECIVRIIPILILFNVMRGVCDKIVTHWYQFVTIILRYLVGGLVLGCILGKLKAKFLCWLYNEPQGALCVSIGMTFLSYYLAEFQFSFSGGLTILCMICFVAIEKHRFTSEVDTCLSCFWGTLHYISDIAILMTSTMEITIYVVKFFIARDMYGTIIMYFSGIILRFLCFLLLGPILNRMTYEMNVKCLMVLGWSDVKGTFNLLLALILLSEARTADHAKAFLVEILVYTFLSHVVNSASMKLALRIMGLSELSASRRTNMNNCMKYIMEKRYCVINILKMNRYLANANWNLVRNETIMKHPYKSVLADLDNVNEGEEDDEILWNRTTAVCPDCQKEVPFDISEKEFAELLKESQIKILKAKKVSIIKQYENGIIDKNCLQVLVHNLEIMIESNKQTNAFTMNRYMKKNRILSMLVKVISKIYAFPDYPPPQTQWRRLWFYLVMHIAYDYFLYGICIINVFLCLWNDGQFLGDSYCFHVFIWLIFLADFILKITALSTVPSGRDGFQKYFRSHWNKFDFILLVLGIPCFIFCYGNKLYFRKWIIFYVIPTFRTLAVIRLLKIFYLLGIMSPYIIRAIEYRIDSRICFGFDLATALVNCSDEILETINQILDMKMLCDIFQKKITTEREMMIKDMSNIQRERPWIAITVKTKQAIRTTLTAMEESLNDLKVSGFVDNMEFAFIVKEIFEKQKFLRNIKFVQPSPPKVIFNEVPWMSGNDAIIEFLYNNVQTVNWDAGEVICKDGKLSKGIYIVVTGLLKLKYTPKQSIWDRSKAIGNMPIIDYLSTLNLDRKIEDNVMSGNSIGELCVLTGRPYDCTIMAESPSQAYLLTTEVVKQAMKLSPNPITGLEARMWKCSVINIAVAIMMEVPLYQSYTQEQIKFKLEKSFMPNLKCYKVFVITELMDDVILIEGVVSDYNSGELFTAPTIIPRTIQKLILPRSSYLIIDEYIEARLLIVPMGDAKNFDIMYNEEDVAEIVSTPSSKCLLHTVQYTKKKFSNNLQRKRVDRGPILTKESFATTQYAWEDNKTITVLDSFTSSRKTDETMSDENKSSARSVILLKNRILNSKEDLSQATAVDEPFDNESNRDE